MKKKKKPEDKLKKRKGSGDALEGVGLWDEIKKKKGRLGEVGRMSCWMEIRAFLSIKI